MEDKDLRNSGLPFRSNQSSIRTAKSFLKRKQNKERDERLKFKNPFKSPWSITSINLLCNPNIKVEDSTEYEELREVMEDIFTKELNDKDVLNEIFGHYPLVKKVKFGTSGIEIGKKHKKIHVHLNVVIEHKVAKYSMVKLAARLKSWLDNVFHIPGKPYWYVHGERGGKDVAFANYNNKELREPANESIKSEFPDEVDRLSSYLPRVRGPDREFEEQYN